MFGELKPLSKTDPLYKADRDQMWAGRFMFLCAVAMTAVAAMRVYILIASLFN